jgi:hypothetical protein
MKMKCSDFCTYLRALFAELIICVFSLQSTSGSDLTVKWGTGGLLVGLDNKENKSKGHGSVVTQIKGPMDSYVIAQRKKSAVSSGKFLTTSDSSSNITFGSCKFKTVSGMEVHLYNVWLQNNGTYNTGCLVYSESRSHVVLQRSV